MFLVLAYAPDAIGIKAVSVGQVCAADDLFIRPLKLGIKMIHSLIFVAGCSSCSTPGLGNLPAPEDFRSTLELPEPGYTDQDRAEMDRLFQEVE